MKKLFCILSLLSLFSLSFAEIKWRSAEAIQDFKEKTGVTNFIQAIADCDTEAEAKQVAKVNNLEPYFTGYVTTDEPSKFTGYIVLYATVNGSTWVYVYKYTLDTPAVEIYTIYKAN